MRVLEHWHPVLLGTALRHRPVGVKLHDREIVVFRTASGRVAALDEVCPHRRMRLSLGRVIGEKLQCKYHGWTYACDGQGESPGAPKLHACATTYDAREEYGAVWVRQAGADTEFPRFPLAGYHAMGVLQHTVRAPLEVTIDNFTEIEHTPTAHAMFGYPLERMPEVKVTFEATDTTVRTINVGPSKPLPWYLNLVMGVRGADLFIDDWTTYFSPCYSMYDHEWGDPDSGRRARIGWRLFIVWSPRSQNETLITTFSYARSTYPGPMGGLRFFRRMMRNMLDKEIQLDVDILEGLASHDSSIAGMKLSRFDRSLGLNRERIQTIYRGESAVRLPLAG